MTAEAAKTLRRTAIVASLLLAILAAGAISTAKSRADAPVLGTAEPIYLNAGDDKRRFLLRETKRAGAGRRLNAFWFMLAPLEPTTPRDPADPRYDFSELDDAVREADRQGLEIMMTLQRAPEWAESEPNNEDRGAWKPDVDDYGDYVHAVATRYSGSYADPEQPAVTLPRVRYYQAWNEGNLEKFYAPQRVGGESVSADRYRRLLNNAYAEFKAVDPDNQVVVAGRHRPARPQRQQPHRGRGVVARPALPEAAQRPAEAQLRAGRLRRLRPPPDHGREPPHPPRPQRRGLHRRLPQAQPTAQHRRARGHRRRAPKPRGVGNRDLLGNRSSRDPPGFP